MKKRLLGPVLAMALMGLAPATAAAAEVNMGSNTVTQAPCDAGSNRGGAAALTSLVAAAVAVGGVNVIVCDVLNNSLNNLLQNADIHVIENILNNSPILSGITIQDITVNALTGVTTITVLGGPVLVLQ
jgi:hypothetical protein